MQVRACSHNDSRVVPAHGDVLRPGGRCQAEDEDQHGDDEQQHRHYNGFPLPSLKGTCEARNGRALLL